MAVVESRKFCCCLPVRLGVFILSLVAMVGGSIVGAVGWVSISQLHLNPVEVTDEIALYVHSGMFSLLGLLGMLGFVGSLAKNRGCVVAFSIGIACHLGLSIASGAFTIYCVFKEPTKQALAACLKGKKDAESLKMCETGMSIVRGVMVAIYVIAWLIELYAYFIVSRYVDQLDEEEMAALAPILPVSVNDRDLKYSPSSASRYSSSAAAQAKKHQTYNGYAKHFTYSAYTQELPQSSDRESKRSSYSHPAPSYQGHLDNHGAQPQPNGRETYDASAYQPSVQAYQRDTMYTTSGPDYQEGPVAYEPLAEHPVVQAAKRESLPSWPPREAYGVSRGRDAA